MQNDTCPPESGKIRRVSMVEQVCSALKQSIINEQWRVGDCLPSEAELASRFGVNRLTVRMALQKLNTIGLAETRIGEGTYVTDFSLVAFLNEVSEVYLDPKRMNDVTALRKLIENECAQLACAKATDGEIHALRQTVDDYLMIKKVYQAALDTQKDLDSVIEADLRIHAQICLMSHNHLYRDLFSLIKPLIKKQLAYQIMMRNSLWEQRGRRDGDDQHMPVLAAIETRDRVACQKAYIALIDFKEQ